MNNENILKMSSMSSKAKINTSNVFASSEFEPQTKRMQCASDSLTFCQLVRDAVCA